MTYKFETYELDPERRELRSPAGLVTIEPLTFNLLMFLIDNRERAVTKDEINQAVWDGRIVSENALSSAIHAARAAIGDSGREQRLIKTVHGKGFRFIGELLSGGSESEAPAATSIAVLPFDNLSGDSSKDYFADGMCEDIITALAKIPGLHVAARNSSFAYRGKNPDIRTVGQELGVRHVLEGSVRWAGGRIRVTGQLIDTQTGLHSWAERYDRLAGDIFDLQDEMTREIVSALQITLTVGDAAKLWAGGTKNYRAWENLMQARFMMWTNARDKVSAARALMEDAIRLDPDYADAHEWMAFSHWQDMVNGWSDDPAVSFMSCHTEAEKALAIDPDSTYALIGLAHTSLISGDHDKATRLAERAHQIQPRCSTTMSALGYVDYYCGRLDRALQLFTDGEKYLHDFKAFFPMMRAFTLGLLGRLDAAKAATDEALDSDPEYVFAYMVAAFIENERGEFDAARAAMNEAIKREPNLHLAALAPIFVFKDPALGEPIRQAWLKAGLPA